MPLKATNFKDKNNSAEVYICWWLPDGTQSLLTDCDQINIIILVLGKKTQVVLMHQSIPAAPIHPPSFAYLVSPGGGALANFFGPEARGFGYLGTTPLNF